MNNFKRVSGWFKQDGTGPHGRGFGSGGGQGCNKSDDKTNSKKD